MLWLKTFHQLCPSKQYTLFPPILARRASCSQRFRIIGEESELEKYTEQLTIWNGKSAKQFEPKTITMPIDVILESPSYS
jgi:hypothetical protein